MVLWISFFVKVEFERLRLEISEIEKRIEKRAEKRKKKIDTKRGKDEEEERKKEEEKTRKSGKIVYTIMKRWVFK